MHPPPERATGARHRDPGPWPNAEQTLLLHAALGNVDRAPEAFDRWRDVTDPASLDNASRRLLPLAWWNLERHGIPASRLDVLRQAFTKTWVRNQQLLDTLRTVLEAFRSAGAPALLFKGAALALGVYPKLGLRPMLDLDLLVPHAALADAGRVLEGIGARRTADDPDQRRALLHGTELLLQSAGSSVAIDLHRSTLWECRRPGDDDSFWASSIPVTGSAIQARMLCPADHLLVVCIHGLRWSQVRPIYWVADAMMLIESPQQPIDWSRLNAEARRRRLEWPLAKALQFLMRNFHAAIPPHVIEQLEAGAAPLRDRLELACRSRPPHLLRGLALHWFDHKRMSATSSLPVRLATFPGYLREMWALESLWDVPAQGIRKALLRCGIPVGDGKNDRAQPPRHG